MFITEILRVQYYLINFLAHEYFDTFLSNNSLPNS